MERRSRYSLRTSQFPPFFFLSTTVPSSQGDPFASLTSSSLSITVPTRSPPARLQPKSLTVPTDAHTKDGMLKQTSPPRGRVPPLRTASYPTRKYSIESAVRYSVSHPSLGKPDTMMAVRPRLGYGLLDAASPKTVSFSAQTLSSQSRP